MNIKNILFKNFHKDKNVLPRTSMDNVFDKDTGFSLDTLIDGLTDAVVDIGANYFSTTKNFSYSDNQGYHNSIYRGVDFGSAITDDQLKRIRDGSFYNMFIGDRWTINGVSWIIADFDYWYGAGTTALYDHHVVVTPMRPLFNAKIYNQNNTAGGFYNSLFFTGTGDGTIEQVRNIVYNTFGEENVLKHSMWLPDACTNGYYTSLKSVTTDIIFPNEMMIFGTRILGNVQSGNNAIGTQHKQLALFTHSNREKTTRKGFWMTDVADTVRFSCYSYDGKLDAIGAGYNTYGIRPVFAIG